MGASDWKKAFVCGFFGGVLCAVGGFGGVERMKYVEVEMAASLGTWSKMRLSWCAEFGMISVVGVVGVV